jgi:hypothetical protein
MAPSCASILSGRNGALLAPQPRLANSSPTPSTFLLVASLWFFYLLEP